VAPASIFAPAKLNLFLAVTGRRADGFHDLVSVVSPLTYGDTLRAEPASGFSLVCAEPGVPVDASNLVLKAAAAFNQAAAEKNAGVTGARFFLDKRIPMGAGLGGGSSDAVAALRLLNGASGSGPVLGAGELVRVAAQVGSDCPLFLHDGPVIMRGRGERVTALPAAEAEARVAAWIGDPAAPLETLLYNNMEGPAFAKYLALPVLLEQLRSRFGLIARMSGSGSACFALLGPDTDAGPILAAIREAWGQSAFAIETRLAAHPQASEPKT